ncbi:MAG: hypothetical protein P8X46_06165 [Nitrospirales bacterium]
MRQLDEAEFTVPLYRHILAKAVEHVDQEGQVNLEALCAEFSQDAAYESVISRLSVWDLYFEDVSAHVVGCLRVLENKHIERLMEELIGQLKVAERDGRQETVDALNVEINMLQGKKALLTVSS